jgi:hypothetical protein
LDPFRAVHDSTYMLHVVGHASLLVLVVKVVIAYVVDVVVVHCVVDVVVVNCVVDVVVVNCVVDVVVVNCVVVVVVELSTSVVDGVTVIDVTMYDDIVVVLLSVLLLE